MTSPFNLEAHAGERIWITGDTVQIKATAADTGGAYTMIEAFASQEMVHLLISIKMRMRLYTCSKETLRYSTVSIL